MFCNTFLPLKLDLYYATTSQNDFGSVEKVWAFSQTIRANLSMSTNYKDQQIQPDQVFWVQDILSGRTLVDPRITALGALHSMTNVLITNIRNDKDIPMFVETVGELDGTSTVFELGGVLPHMGPFGDVDYYKIVIKRSDMQELSD
jgi:hypothetical protein